MPFLRLSMTLEFFVSRICEQFSHNETNQADSSIMWGQPDLLEQGCHSAGYVGRLG